LAILFADLVDSTVLSTRLEPESYRVVVGRYREQVLGLQFWATGVAEDGACTEDISWPDRYGGLVAGTRLPPGRRPI
jgi:hypothetical protein